MTDNVSVGDVLELKFGSELQSVQFMGKVTAARPFGSIAAHLSPNTIARIQLLHLAAQQPREKGL